MTAYYIDLISTPVCRAAYIRAREMFRLAGSCITNGDHLGGHAAEACHIKVRVHFARYAHNSCRLKTSTSCHSMSRNHTTPDFEQQFTLHEATSARPAGSGFKDGNSLPPSWSIKVCCFTISQSLREKLPCHHVGATVNDALIYLKKLHLRPFSRC